MCDCDNKIEKLFECFQKVNNSRLCVLCILFYIEKARFCSVLNNKITRIDKNIQKISDILLQKKQNCVERSKFVYRFVKTK